MKHEEIIRKDLYYILIALLFFGITLPPLFWEFPDRSILMEELTGIAGFFDGLGIGFVHQHLSLFWRGVMILIQAGTLAASILLLEGCGAGRMGKLMGAMLYAASPAILYARYDLGSLTASMGYLLMPLALWMIIEGFGKKERRILLCPGILGFGALLFLFRSVAVCGEAMRTGGANDLGGYRIGQYLMIFTYQEGHPGPGLAVLATWAVMGAYLFMGRGRFREALVRRDKMLMTASLFCYLAAFAGIPGGSFWVGLGTLFTMPFASETYCCMIEDEDIAPWNIWIPMGIFLAGIGVSCFLCKELF